jgi:hypothetical protein
MIVSRRNAKLRLGGIAMKSGLFFEWSTTRTIEKENTNPVSSDQPNPAVTGWNHPKRSAHPRPSEIQIQKVICNLDFEVPIVCFSESMNLMGETMTRPELVLSSRGENEAVI